MKQLSEKALQELNQNIEIPQYDRSKVTPGILHFGVGNFHRCHQAKYIDDLLSQGEISWGIIGVSMRSEEIRDKLEPQDYLYTLATLGHQSQFRIIGSILKILVAPENPAVIVKTIADNDIKLITTTITEKGYCLSSGSVDLEHPSICHDKISLDKPQSIYGYLAAGIIQRYESGARPLSILCCDNLQGGGCILKNGVMVLLENKGQEIKNWTEDNVSFASSMVDRVSPATGSELKKTVAVELGLSDAWPVSSEPFSQWVIEDKFAGKRPTLENVGALIVKDVSIYENMKLQILNASHSIISILGFLNGKTYVHESLQEPDIKRFISQALDRNILPVAKIPSDFNGQLYASDVLQRFQNDALPYSVRQVAADSSQKILQRWFPAIDLAIKAQVQPSYFAFSIAAWICYIELALSNEELIDPLDHLFLLAENSLQNRVAQFLEIAGAKQFQFFTNKQFMNSVNDYHAEICSRDSIRGSINYFLTSINKAQTA